jgi:hypothetical protein
MSDSLSDAKLIDKILAARIEDLNLSVRSYNSLKRAGIDSLSQVIDLGEDGVSRIRHLGQQQLDEIFDTVAAFLGISRVSLIGLTTEGEVCKLPEITEVDAIPEIKTPAEVEEPPKIKKTRILQDARPFIVEIEPDTSPNLVEVIVPFAKKSLEAMKYKREFEVLKRRFGLEGSKTYTLQEIGYYYDLSRERVRQIEERATSKIKNILLGVSRLSRYRVPQNLIDETNKFLSLLRSRDAILTEKEIIQIAEERYQFKITSQKLNNLHLLLDVFEFQPLPRKIAGTARELVPAWIIIDEVKTQTLFQATKAVSRIMHASASPISSFDLKIKLNSRRKKQISSSYIDLAIRLLPEVEIIDNGESYQVKIEYLPSLADQAYRVLYESGEPIHLRNIQRQINHRLAKAGFPADVQIRNIGNQLASDARFEAIGRSGIWSLAEWEGIHRKTIVELMKEFFHIKQISATPDEIFKYVSSKRKDISEKSIILYLTTNDAFIRVTKTGYELAAWGSQPYESKAQMSSAEIKKRFSPAVKTIFADTPDNSMPLSQLTHELSNRTGIPESTLYVKIRQSPMIQLKDDPASKGKKWKKKIAYYIGDKQTASALVTSARLTIRDTVQQEVRQYLQKQPSRKSAVTDLSVYIEKVTGCKKTTFYRYLSEMVEAGEIRKEYEGRKLHCYLESAEVYETPVALFFPQIENVQDNTLKENLVRATKNFNLDNIDMGLFQLGKIFENEVKAFLTEAREKGRYTISGKDLARLALMIDCVERNGIIKQKHHLTLLREHRNERAHGEIPDLVERKRLMQHAPFLGDLYIKYILFFSDQRKNL